MRTMVAVVLALAVLWAGYWFVGARVVTAQAERLFADATAQGLEAGRDGLSVRGFPNRFDLTLDAPRLYDPATGLGWAAPFLQIFALTWQPWHLIAAFPPEQRFETPAGAAVLAAGKLQASLRARPRAALPLDRLTLVGERLVLVSDPIGTLSAEELRFATRDVDGAGTVHAVGLEILNLVPDPARLAVLGAVPARIDRLRLDAELGFDAPLDRFAPLTRPALTGLRVIEALAVWGDIAIHAKGSLTPDAAGLAEGSLDLRLTNWRQLLPMAVAAGLLTAEAAPTWERMLGLFAQQSGDGDSLDVTLRFAGGRVSLGPLPLGPAPRLR